VANNRRVDKPARRGRPPKYGRPAQVVTMTLPEDVLEWLRKLHPDPAWGVVKLFERSQQLGGRSPGARQVAELVPLPRGRSLILVQPDALRHVKGVAVIPLADGRGFLALEPGRGLPDLELALLDRLEASDLSADERTALLHMREIFRGWRQQGVRFEERAILVAERASHRGATRRGAALSELATVE
jgi:hypothetical protein